jgi:hypothetical protein
MQKALLLMPDGASIILLRIKGEILLKGAGGEGRRAGRKAIPPFA